MTDDWVSITEDEAAVLNAARDTLAQIGKRAQTEHTWEAGTVFAITETATHAVFQVMNYANSYGKARLPETILHNRTAKEIQNVR